MRITAFLVLLLVAVPAAADGFHSPLLREKSPKEWAKTVRESLGLDRSDSAENDSGAGEFDRRAGAGRLVDILRYLDKRNVLLREFPDFNYDQIPGFKTETEALLVALGREAVPILVETLIRDLKGGNTGSDLKLASDFVERVIHILIEIGEASLPKVMEHLGDEDPRVEAALLKILHGIVTEPDFGGDVEAWRRWWKIREAGRLRDGSAVPDLVERLGDADARLRLAAARALGEIGSRKAVPALRKLLRSAKEKSLLAAVLRALAKIGDAAAAPDMIDRLEDSRREVREEAVTALRFLSHRSFGFDAGGTKEDRARAVDRWRTWWKTR